ncbi:MAG: hypothetical protein AAGC57_07175 [Pseudomonadota bacterium]
MRCSTAGMCAGADGTVLRGIDAVALTLQASPRWRWAGTLATTPALRPLGWIANEIFAALLFAWNRRRGNF